jgi:hypothetical protein
MQKIVVFIMVLLYMPITAICAQITREQADKTVSEYIKKEITEYYWLYVNNNLDSDKGHTTIPVWNKRVLNVDYSSFVYFVDEYPYAMGAPLSVSAG